MELLATAVFAILLTLLCALFVFYGVYRKQVIGDLKADALVMKNLHIFDNISDLHPDAYDLNPDTLRSLIAEYHKYPALPPVFDFMDNEAPANVRKMKPVWTEDGYILFWTAPKYEDEMNRAVQYVVYRFDAKEKVNIDDPSHIVAITRDNFYKLPYEDGKTKYRYVVTALDRLHNESKSVGKKVKL